MKKFIQASALILALLFSQEIAKADSSTFLINQSTTNLLLTGPLRLLSITVGGVQATNGAIDFYDSANAFTTNWVGAFTNIVKVVATTNLIYTNIFGVTSTNSYPVIFYTTNTAAGAMKTRAKFASIFALSNTVTQINFDSLYVGYGVLASNVTTMGPVNVTIVYDELK